MPSQWAQSLSGTRATSFCVDTTPFPPFPSIPRREDLLLQVGTLGSPRFIKDTTQEGPTNLARSHGSTSEGAASKATSSQAAGADGNWQVKICSLSSGHNSGHHSPSECPAIVTGGGQSQTPLWFLLSSTAHPSSTINTEGWLAGWLSFPFPHLHPQPLVLEKVCYMPYIHHCHTLWFLLLIKWHCDDIHVYHLRAWGGCYSLTQQNMVSWHVHPKALVTGAQWPNHGSQTKSNQIWQHTRSLVPHNAFPNLTEEEVISSV